MGALKDFVAKKFGRSTRAITNPVTDTCGTTATVLLQNNPDRLAAIIINLGATAMYVAWDRDVSASHGILVVSGGGSLTLIADEDGELVGYELYGVAITNPVDVFVMEVEAE